jgi:hypothetical protein
MINYCGLSLAFQFPLVLLLAEQNLWLLLHPTAQEMAFSALPEGTQDSEGGSSQSPSDG